MPLDVCRLTVILVVSCAVLDHVGRHRGEGVGFNNEPAFGPFAALFDANHIVHAGVFLWKPDNLLTPVGMSNIALDVHVGSHRILLSTSDQMVGRAGLEPATLSDGIYNPTA